MKTPVAVFAYRRPRHLDQALVALGQCVRLDDCHVHIFCDGPRGDEDAARVASTREIARAWAARHPARVVERDENRGLARSIAGEVSALCAESGRVIVLEDDLQPAPDFLVFMLAALDRYACEPRVMQVAGFRPRFPWLGGGDACLLPCTTTWGWATWQRAWQHFAWEPAGIEQLRDPAVRRAFDLGDSYPYSQMLEDRLAGRNDSWGILWWWAVFRARGLVLYPRESLVTVGGFDGSGTHCDEGSGALVHGQSAGRFPWEGAVFPDRVEPDPAALRELGKILRAGTSAPGGISAWWRRLQSMLSPR